jgi:hypothetical protein
MNEDNRIASQASLKSSAASARSAATVRTHTSASKKQATSRTNDPVRTMAEILEVATREFAQKGLAGARIDEIAKLTRTSKRMIYYHQTRGEDEARDHQVCGERGP